MLHKALLALAGIGALCWAIAGFFSMQQFDPSSTSNPDVTSIAVQTKVRSGVSARIASQGNLMRKVIAASEKEAGILAWVSSENKQLHNDVKNACQSLQQLGQSPQQIEEWLRLIQWPELIKLEREFEAYVKQP